MVNKKFVILIVTGVLAIDNGAAIFTSSGNRLAQASMSTGNQSSPVLLVHSPGEDASMWKK
jgi:triacylglycerol esterase/lipase EstA (alpha/beta hydrolase family)